MKLLILAIQFKGGSLQGVVSIIRELVKFKDNEYHIIISQEVKNQVQGLSFPRNMHFYDLPHRSDNHTANAFLNRVWLRRKEKTLQPDVVLDTSGPIYWTPHSPCLLGFNLPHHVYRDSPYFDTISLMSRIRWFLRRTFHRYYFRREGDAFFVQTDDVNVRLRQFLNRSGVYTVPNTYSISYREVEHFPNKLPPLLGNTTRCLTISAYYPHKNLGIISKVVDKLDELGRKDIQFVVTLSQEQYNHLFAAEYKSRIVNVGFVPSKEGPSLYNECDIMFLPTLLECFSASYAEAMVMGKPIITSDMGFAHCVCKDAAIYFDPTDVDDITTKLLNLIDNKALQADLVIKGKEMVKQFGTSEDRTREILALCKKLTKTGKRR